MNNFEWNNNYHLSSQINARPFLFDISYVIEDLKTREKALFTIQSRPYMECSAENFMIKGEIYPFGREPLLKYCTTNIQNEFEVCLQAVLYNFENFKYVSTNFKENLNFNLHLYKNYPYLIEKLNEKTKEYVNRQQKWCSQLFKISKKVEFHFEEKKEFLLISFD